jgi:hypothetical protein
VAGRFFYGGDKMRLFVEEILLFVALLWGCSVLQAEEPVEKHSDRDYVQKLFEETTAKYPHLELDEKLCRDSQKWAEHLARTGRFHHDKGVRENIARGYKSCRDTVRAWFKSSGHNRQFQVNKCIGFGASEKDGRRIWVCRFR